MDEAYRILFLRPDQPVPVCHVLNPGMIFEIGRSAVHRPHMAMNSGPDCRIFTLDLPKDRGLPEVRLRTTLMDDPHSGMEVGEYYFSATPHASRIQLLFGDSAAFDFSPYHGKIDLFFIDGAHSYDYVRCDTENALQCVRPGGVIAWHDFGRVGLNQVSKYIRELSRRLTIYSVPGGSLAFAVM